MITETEWRQRRKLGRDIKKAMDGRSQKWLADKLGLPADYISNKINGQRTFSQSEIEQINVILGTTFQL